MGTPSALRTPSEAHCGQAFERFTDDGPMALLPLPENRCALVWTRAGMDARRLAEIDERAFLEGRAVREGLTLGLGVDDGDGAADFADLDLAALEGSGRKDREESKGKHS